MQYLYRWYLHQNRQDNSLFHMMNMLFQHCHTLCNQWGILTRKTDQHLLHVLTKAQRSTIEYFLVKFISTETKSLIVSLIQIQGYTLALTVLRADLNGPNFTYPGVLWAVHIGPNFDIKNCLL